MMNTMDQIEVRYGEDGKLVSIQEFFKAENLSGITKKIQDSLKDLYRLNGENNPPLFHFPNFPKDKPLIVDCTTPTDDDCMAHYKNGEHIIEFVRNLHDNPHITNSSFTGLLAHELAHAEVDVIECRDIVENGNQYALIQLINEANAFAKQHMIEGILDNNQVPYSDLERTNAVKSEMEWLVQSDYYRYRWDSYYPMKSGDLPLTSIPHIFHLPDDLLASIPTLPELVSSDFYQEFRERSWTDLRDRSADIFNFFWNRYSTPADVKNLLRNIIFNKDTSTENLYKDLRMVHFLLEFRGKDGKTPMLDEDIFKEVFQHRSVKNDMSNSKFLILLESKVDSDGNRLFPEDFSKKAQNMTLSEFTTCFDHFFDFAGWKPLYGSRNLKSVNSSGLQSFLKKHSLSTQSEVPEVQKRKQGRASQLPDRQAVR